jgi:nitrous oxidase accessory protein
VKKSASFIVLLLFFSVVLVSLPQNGIVKAEPKTIVVPDDYSTIQEAIEKVDEGDTMIVKKGVYDGPINETLTINKTVSLIGEETTIFNLHPLLLNKTLFYQPYLTYNTSLIVAANNVTISGFTINTPSPGGGISITSNGTRITNCSLTPTVSLTSSHSIISESSLKSNLNLNGSNNTINQCSIRGDVGLSGTYNIMTGNAIDAEINLKGSYNTISDSSFYRIFLENSDSNTIHNNTLSCIWIGFYGHTSSNNTVSGNILNGGYIWGILMGDGSYNVFHDNLICNYTGSHDGYGIAIGGNHFVAEYNTFYRNTLMNNNRNVAANWKILGAGNFWDNGEVGNYWDDYNGTDSDGDGIGDSPYIVEGWKWDDAAGGHVEFIFGQDNYPLMEPTIIPEFSSWTPLLIMLVTVLVIAVIYRRRLHKQIQRRGDQ